VTYRAVVGAAECLLALIQGGILQGSLRACDMCHVEAVKVLCAKRVQKHICADATVKGNTHNCEVGGRLQIDSGGSSSGSWCGWGTAAALQS
jgi:hypothetical protein